MPEADIPLEPGTNPVLRASAITDGCDESRNPPGEPTVQEHPPVDLRRQILARFEAWLDEAMSGEAPPQGIDAEILSRLKDDSPAEQPSGLDGCDLYSLWSALVALTGETRLQGRAFKQLCEALGPVRNLADNVGSLLDANREALETGRTIPGQAGDLPQEREEQAMQAAHEAACREFLDLLLDLRDRLDRGLRSVEQHAEEAQRIEARGWFRRAFGRARQVRLLAGAMAALTKGYELSLDRLEESLDRLGVDRIDCEHLPFDPDRMRAVDVAETTDVPNGTVLEVYRAGYEWRGQVYRLAEVKVARSPTDRSAQARDPGDLDPQAEAQDR